MSRVLWILGTWFALGVALAIPVGKALRSRNTRTYARPAHARIEWK